jgi:hypothetical protein
MLQELASFVRNITSILTVPHLKLSLLFFFQKQKKTLLHLRLSFILSWEKQTPHEHISAHLSAAHPSVSEEVEGYKNNFVFIRVPDLNFKRWKGRNIILFLS